MLFLLFYGSEILAWKNVFVLPQQPTPTENNIIRQHWLSATAYRRTIRSFRPLIASLRTIGDLIFGNIPYTWGILAT
jgi:hypothetical protein